MASKALKACDFACFAGQWSPPPASTGYATEHQCEVKKIPQSEQIKIAKSLRSRSFNEDDKKTLNAILETVESFKNKIENLRNELKTSKQEIENPKNENGELQQQACD